MKTDAEHRADLMADPDDSRHGTTRGARLMCPCPACAEARAAMYADRRDRERAKQAARVDRLKASYPKPRKPARKPLRNPAKDVCTVDAIMLPMMGKPSIDNEAHACCVCGAGNASGCHGKAHDGMLHFRWVESVRRDNRTGEVLVGGHLECIETDEPTKYQDALAMDGWRPL